MRNILFTFLVFISIFSLNNCSKEKLHGLNDSHCNASAPEFNTSLDYDSVIDIDGNVYKTITIGSQTWMAENLRTIHFQNGDLIYQVTNSSIWENLDSAGYCNYNFINDCDAINIYGRLYNWYAAVDARNIAPNGWRVPTADDWEKLLKFVDKGGQAGVKLKESGLAHWHEPNSGTTNDLGFTALPGGSITVYGGPIGIGEHGSWWSSSPTIGYETLGYGVAMFYNYGLCRVESEPKKGGSSIRCIKN